MILALLLATVATAAPATPRAAPVATLAPDAEARWVPFDLTPGNQIRFTMSLDDRPVTAILDTGVSVSVLSRDYAQRHRVPVRQEGRADVIGGSLDVGRADTRTLAIGGLTRRGGSLVVADLPAAATRGDSGDRNGVDMLVGRDLTAPWALDIDYQARRFRLLRSGRMPFTGAAAPLSIAPDRQLYMSALTIAGHRVAPVVVDTGDGAAVTLSAAGWRTANLGTPATTAISYGLAGAVESELSIVPQLALGTATASEVEVRREAAGGFSDTIGVAGRIGSGLLQRFRVLLDPGAGHMLLRALPPTVQERSTSGLLLAFTGDRLSVLHVMRASPAAAAGWRVDEAICAVDGTPVSRAWLATPAARWTTGTPGTTVTLRMCDGTHRTLTLQRFY
ncbi:MAG: aspartyl protease family protein [Sphingomonas adhaesiva]|uniref:aspartyl protease family protein n=1 Tax=Sphingomonas adhaesiva TaxID=28212 RepID=UPI002FFA7099